MAEEKEIPFGATAKNVADDVPIMASEGEYIIPANVVKFLGLEKIEKLVSKAKEHLAEMGKAVDGEGGEVEDEEFPFDPSELQSVPEMAEGGPVGGFQFPTNTGPKEFKNKDGNSIFIPMFNGKPMFAPPEGYTEGEAPKGADPDAVANKQARQVAQPLMSQDNSADENDAFVEKNKSPLAGNPNDWGVKDFIDFGRNRDSAGNNAVRGIISMMPGGKLAMKAREKWLDGAVAKQFDAMLETGMDPKGNVIGPEERTQLLSTREHLKQQMSKDVGLDFGPMETLANAVQRFTSFTRGQGQVQQSAGGGQPASSLNAEGTKMTTPSSNAPNNSDSQYSGGYGLGSDMDRDPSKGPSSGQMASGGLYAEGGYVTKRKKK